MFLAIYILLLIVLVVLVVAALLPATFSVKRSVEVNKPIEQVFDYALDFHQFSHWSPWFDLEPDAEVTVTASKMAGDVYAWKGKKVGEGSFTLIGFNAPSTIETRIDFIKPWKTTAHNFYRLEFSGSSTKITWEHQGKGSYPIGRYFNLLMDGFLGKDFQKGLEKLKSNLENK